MGFEEYLNTPGVDRVVITLEKHGKPITFRLFAHESGFSEPYARKLRDTMSRFGLIDVSWENKRTQVIELTSYGKKFAQLVHQQGRLIEEASKAVGKDPPPPP